MFLEFPAAGTKTAAVLPGAKGTFAAGHFAATLQQSGHAGHAGHGHPATPRPFGRRLGQDMMAFSENLGGKK
jgi:hypothetical protein